ncbi:MAG: GcrA family cell cycle regulator [Alphaproteobacteria bacterium]|nr:GcrA family cell cycle regulator [Alphaproteobacteria bacterium]
MSKGWDSVALKKLKALTGKGLSTAEIGKRLGMSKNAIVGKLNRLGWNAKAGGATKADPAKEKKPVAKKTVAKGTTVKKTVAKKATANVEDAVKKPMDKKTGAKKAAVAPKVTAKKVKVEVVKPVKEATTKTSSSKTSAKNLAMHQRIIQHSLEMANLKPNQCRWPIGDPDSEHFHFCGETVFIGKPYCYEHCKQAYQFAPPKKK